MASRNSSGASSDVFNKETFLTSLQDAGVDEAITPPVVSEPLAMKDVREKYAELKEVIGSLSTQIGAVLGKQEQDFLAAYRAHMYNVQKDVHELRKKLEMSEASDQKNEKMQAIEDERNWYRKEALRLDSFANTMKKDLKLIKEKLQGIEEDRTWLEKQLKTSKKQNKLLRGELEIRLQSTQMPAENGIEIPSLGTKPKLSAAENQMSEETMLDLFEDRERAYRKQIRQLKRETQSTKQELTKLRSAYLAKTSHSSELESFFVRCIDSVKRDIARRRKETESKRKGPSSLSLSEFSEFTSSDRVQVIERLLSHDEVLSFLYDHLFPQNKQNEDGSKAIASETPCLPERLVRSTTTEPGNVSTIGGATVAPVGSAVAAVNATKGSIVLDDSTQEYLGVGRPSSSLM